MKILIAHSFYRTDMPSGENQVVQSEMRMLRKHGHQVQLFSRESDNLGKFGRMAPIVGAISNVWNPSAVQGLLSAVASFEPDVVHVHNTFPMLSPAIFRALSGKCPVVLTLHNYRLFCASGIPMRNGQVCIDCIEARNVAPAIKHGCYRQSRIATIPVAASVGLHRAIHTWSKHVSAFIALTSFQKAVMITGGLPQQKTFVKPNFYSGLPELVDWEDRRDRVVFVGRLSEEKGLRTLLEAWRRMGADAPPLDILGDGPLRTEIQAAATGLPIVFHGQLSNESAQRKIAKGKLLIVPSEWFEGFPIVIVEAFAHGTPVAVSDIGSLPSIVEGGRAGFIFEPGNPGSLAEVIKSALSNDASLKAVGGYASTLFETTYNEDANHRALVRIYMKAIEQP